MLPRTGQGRAALPVLLLACVLLGFLGSGSGPSSAAAHSRGVGPLAVPSPSFLAVPRPDAGPYPVTFSEIGLPSHTNWTVNLSGTSQTTNQSSMQFLEPNGSYSFTILSVPGFTSIPTTGPINVTGAPTSRAVDFVPIPPGSPPPPMFLGLSYVQATVLLSLAAVAVLLLLLGLFDCPDKCSPAGAKKGCTSSLLLETYVCGQGPGVNKDVEEGAGIMALGAKVAGKLEVFGDTYAKLLEEMPGWVKAAGKLIERKVGVEVYVTVVCKWNVCATVRCYGIWKRLDWTVDWRFWGPYRLKPGSAFASGSSADCFAPGLDSADLAKGVSAAIDADERVQDARRKCAKVCA